MPKPTPCQRLTAIGLTTLIITLTAAFSGCQEDSRATHSTVTRSAELTEDRLKQATGNLLQTLGRIDSEKTEVPKGISKPELSWSLPFTREDGSALPAEQIAGFQIYYRLRHQNEHQVIAIDNPTATRHSLEGLPTGAYEFAITVLDIDGRESRKSAPVTADIF